MEYPTDCCRCWGCTITRPDTWTREGTRSDKRTRISYLQVLKNTCNGINLILVFKHFILTCTWRTHVKCKGQLLEDIFSFQVGSVIWWYEKNIFCFCIWQRPGAFAIYLEPWHADIFQFLDCKKNTGKEEQRARDLFYALWIPDLFMKRVEKNEEWTLMDPHECPGLFDCWGEEFETLYQK